MKRTKLFITCLLLAMTTALFAQNVQVRGTVSDSFGDPVTGAFVVVTGTTNGTSTGPEGEFVLNNVPRNATLTITFVGMKTAIVPVGSGVINVKLEDDVEQLEQVVVTAQGLTRKQKAIGYSAQTLKAEELTLTHSSALGNSLAGKVAGAQFWGSAGSTFSEGRIILRGPTSYSNQEGNEPIYVVDGTITSAAAVNMEDVENINILKGPSATALYGSRGANGAVIITTKKAQEGQSQIEFSQTTAAEVYYEHFKFQRLFGGGSYSQHATGLYNSGVDDPNDAKSILDSDGNGAYIYDYGEDVNWGPRYDGSTPVRTALSWDPTSSHYGETQPWSYRLNLRDLTRVAWNNTTNVAFTKSVKGMSTRISFTNVDRPGIFYNSKAVRRSFSMSTQLQPTSWLKADISYRYRYRQNKNAEQEGYSSNGNYICDFTQWGHTNVDIKEYKDYLRPDGSWRSWNIVSPTNIAANFHDNPYAVMDNYNYTNTTQYHMISGDVYASLPLNFRLGVRINDAMTNQKYEEKDGSGSINFDPYFRTYQNQSNDMTAQAYLTWSGQFVENRLSIEAAAFAEARRYDYWYLNSATSGGLSVDGYFNLAASGSTYSTNNSETHYRTRSFFGNATIGWDDLVYLDGSIRYDIDSRLPAHNNGYLYGGGSLSFMLSKLINAPWLNFWKIRGSVAQVGSTISAYSVLPTYTVNTKLHGQTTLYEPTTQVNMNILPTISTSYEVGTEFKLFGNRLAGDVNFYMKNTKNDIINANVLPQSGYAYRKMNAGLVRNKGIEVMLSGSPVRTKNVEWFVSANIAKNVNTLVELTEDQHEFTMYDNRFYYSWRLRSIEGMPVGVIETAARWARNENGQLILQKLNPASGKEVNNVGELRPTWETNVNKLVGNVQPDLTGGFNTSLRVKDFTLSASLDYVIGGQMVSWTNMWGAGSGLLDVTAAVNDRGVNVREPVQKGGGVHISGVDKDGNALDGYIDAAYYFQYKYQYDNDGWLYDRTYVKLREVSLRYDVPRSFMSKIKGVSRASIAFVATNPWLIYSACPNIDPSELGGASYNFLEGGQAVSTRSFGLSLNVTF